MRLFDLFTTAVPPALPAVLTSGIIYSIARLREHQIFCVSPTRLQVSGMIKTVVFDKTGTLTDDCLKVMGHRGVIKKKGMLKYSCLNDDVMHHGCSELDFNHNEHLKYAMATCQSTKYIGDKLIGNPHDIKIFEYMGWT
jgi:cation-transporting P-type ATPase 13A2